MTIWSKDMYRYLSWLLFWEVYGMIEWTQQEEKRIEPLIEEAKQKLSRDERLLVENRARRMSNEYQDGILHQMNKMYWHELNSDDGYIPRHITFNSKIHEAWMSAVRKQQTIHIKYDSTTSGVTDRLVNPYQTKSPYGIGYCQMRKEVRQFRFDRIVDIELMNHTFEKPKDWKEKWEESRKYF